MKILKIKEEKKKNKVTLLFKEVSEVFANTFRRLVLEEVPTLAVEEMEVKENSSSLYNEMVALRLGLIPLKTDLRSYDLPEECTCEGAGCSKCRLILTLKAS